MKIKKTYVTFGQNHMHIFNGNTFDCDCVAEVNGGREAVFRIFRNKFCTTYSRLRDIDTAFYKRGVVAANN